jgi:hypothetical protein
MAIKTNWNEVNQIIKEEFQRLMEKNKLKKRIQQINEELGSMEAEDQGLDEVEADGTEKVRSHAWTGKADGDEKFKPKFEKKGSSLLEDEDEEETLDIEDAGEEGEEMGEKTEVNLSDEFAELGAAIEAKIKAVLGGEEAGEAEGAEGEEDFEEIEVGDEPEGIEVVGAEGSEEEGEEEDKEVDEYAEVHGGIGAEQGMTADQAVKKESVQPKKNVHVIKENKETKSAYLNLLSEGLDKNQKSALQNEVDRMRKLAKLDNNE